MTLRETSPPRRHPLDLPEPWRSAAVTVVLPTYNEAANLPVIVAALFSLSLGGLRVLVADDNSPDGTGDVADSLAEQYGAARMTVVHRLSKQGLGRAYADGMTRAMEAGAEFVVQMDSDLSHRPEYLPQLLGTLLSTGADVVVGSRYVAGASLARQWSWHRKALSGFANTYVRVLLRLGIRDVTAGFKLWRVSALKAIDLAGVRSNGYSFQVEMSYLTVKRGLKVVEVPIHFDERREGESKMSLRVQLESALMPLSLRYRTSRPRYAGAAALSGRGIGEPHRQAGCRGGPGPDHLEVRARPGIGGPGFDANARASSGPGEPAAQRPNITPWPGPG